MIPDHSKDYDIILYDVHPGDSLGAIIKRYYGSISPQKRDSVISKIMAENPEIKNRNLIYPGQVLIIDIPKQHTETSGAPKPPVIEADKELTITIKEKIGKASLEEKSLVSHLAPIMIGTGSASMTMIDYTFKTNAPLVSEIAESYNKYKVGELTKGQYDYQRRKLINKLKMKLGPTKLALNAKKPLNEIIRISLKKGTVPTHILNQQTRQMTKLSKLASRGGVVLSVAGLGVACYEIANTNNQQQKNEILVESLGSFSTGAVYGVAATAAVIIMATPVGWVAALVIGVGGALTSYAGGQIAKNIYTRHGTHIDLASVTKVDRLCR